MLAADLAIYRYEHGLTITGLKYGQDGHPTAPGQSKDPLVASSPWLTEQDNISSEPPLQQSITSFPGPKAALAPDLPCGGLRHCGIHCPFGIEGLDSPKCKSVDKDQEDGAEGGYLSIASIPIEGLSPLQPVGIVEINEPPRPAHCLQRPGFVEFQTASAYLYLLGYRGLQDIQEALGR